MRLSTGGKRIHEKGQSTVSVQKLGSCSRHATTTNDTLIWDRLAWLLTPRKGSSLRIEFGVHLDIG